MAILTLYPYLLDIAIVLMQAGANPEDSISNDWGMSAYACAVLNNQTKNCRAYVSKS